MNTNKTSAGDANSANTSIKVLLIRNLTVNEDKSAVRSIYSGVVTVDQIVDINTNDNVRGYIAETMNPTKVHRAIKESLKNDPANFHVLLMAKKRPSWLRTATGKKVSAATRAQAEQDRSFCSASTIGPASFAGIKPD